MESHHNLDITALIAENKIEQAAKLLAQSPEYKKPLDIKLAYCLLLTDIATLKKILKNNGYQIDLATRFEKEPYLESLFWQRLAETDEWSLFTKLVQKNDIHIEPSSKQRHTILSTLVTKKQFKLYLQIVNKLLLRHPTILLENLSEVINHFNQFREIFKLELFKYADENFFEVLRLFLRTKENVDALNTDIENNELFLLAFNEHKVERDEFIKWLLENNRYKKFNLNIDPSFLEAINGKVPAPIVDGECIFDEYGFTPLDHAVISGAKKMESKRHFYRKSIGYNSPPFWEKLLACSPKRLIELIIEMKAWDVLEQFDEKQLKLIRFPKKGKTSLLTVLIQNNQFELFEKICTHNNNFLVSRERLQEYAQIFDQQQMQNDSQKQSDSNFDYLIMTTLSGVLEILKNLNVKNYHHLFGPYNYQINFGENNSLEEQVFFTKLAQLSVQANDWKLFTKIIERNSERHHIQPTSTRKKTLLTDLVENNQFDLFYQILDKYLKEHKDATKEDLQEVSRLLPSVGQLDDNLTYLRLAIKCELRLPNILFILLKDKERRAAHLNFLLQDDNYLKLDPSLQKESILACLGKSTKSLDELAKIPLDSMGLSPYHYLVLSGNKKPLNIKEDFMSVITTYRTPNAKLIDIVCAFNPEYCISALIEQKDWELLKTVVTKNGKYILSQRGYTSFLTTLAASGKWDIYYDCVKTHFNLISSPEYYLRFDEVIRNILEHRVVDHGRLFFAIANQFPKHELLFERLQPWFTGNFTTVKPVAQKKSTVTAPAHKNESTRSDLTNMLTSLSMSNYMTALKQITSDMGNISSKQTTSANSTVKAREKPAKTKKKSRTAKQTSKVEKQEVEITDTDIAEVKAMLSAFTSNLFSCDCTLSKDKSCVITLSGDKTALQFVTGFLKDKKLSRFGSGLQQQRQQGDEKPNFKYVITLNTKQDVQLFMAAFAKTDDKDLLELSKKLETLTPAEDPKKQQDADTSNSDKTEPCELSTDQQIAWIKGLSSAFCKNSNFKSLIKWNETEKCFEVDISSTDWRIKKHKGSKKDYETYKIDALNFHRYILHHITNAIDATLIATSKVSDQKTVKIYPFDKTFLPISKEVHNSIFEAFKQHGTRVLDILPEDSSSDDEKPKESTPNDNNNNAVVVSSVPETLKELFREIANLPEQSYSFLSFKQHEKHTNKWILSFSTKQVEYFSEYHSELFFKALKATFDQHAPGFFSLFGDKKELRISINMAKMPTDFSNLSDTFAREYEKLRFERLLKILFIPSGLLTETNLAELKIEQDKTDIHKWTIHCNHTLTEAVAKAVCDGLQNAPGFITFISSNNNNNSTKLVFNTTCTPSELELKRLQNVTTASPTHKRMKEEIEPVSSSSAKKEDRIPSEGEVYTALVGIMQHLSDNELSQFKELINLIDGLPPLKGDSSLRDKVIQFDLDLYTTRLFWLLAYGEMKYPTTVLEAWDARNVFRHISDEISQREFANIKELFPVLKYLIPFAEAKTVIIKIESDKKDKVMTSLKTFLAPFRKKLEGELRQNSAERSKEHEKLANDIEKLETDDEITPTRKQHAILQAKSISGEYLQAPKNSRKIYPKLGHKGFGIQFGLFATHLYRKYVTPPTDIQSLTFGA